MGLKTDELLHRKICKEYNSTNKYNGHAFPSLNGSTQGEDPPNFKPPLTWEHSKEALEKLIRQYEVSFNNWKKSGNHGEFTVVTGKNDSNGKSRHCYNYTYASPGSNCTYASPFQILILVFYLPEFRNRRPSFGTIFRNQRRR